MENIAELMEFGKDSDSVTQELPSSSESFESYQEGQEGQKEANSELKMIDSDILDIANQVGEEMDENDVSETSLPADLSFLDGAETKETSVEVDDPALSFLVSGGQMEVNSDSLNFLDGQELAEAEMSSEDDGESYSDEEESEEEDDDGDEEDDDERGDENCGEKVIKKEEDTEDDGVFGQVSFYDDSASGHSADVQKVKKTKQKRSKKKRKSNEEGESKGVKKRRKRKRRKTEDEEDDDDDGVPNAGASTMRRKNIRLVLF